MSCTSQRTGDSPVAPWVSRDGMVLLTDLYELTMMAGYWKEGRVSQRVAFEYFFRSLPPDAGFAVAAGLEPFLNYVEHLSFASDDIEYLRSLGLFEEEFLSHLQDFKPNFTIRAVPEGTVVFPSEPVVQVEGGIFEAQLIETALLNMLNHQTLIATKASRICLAADGEPVLEFGLRRAHGPDGGVSGSRASYIGGCAATSNVLAGKMYGIPVAGTHAHSWVMSFPSELESFRAFVRHYPETCTLLVDTYDTLGSGVPNAIKVFTELRNEGRDVRAAIRLDSGDLARLSKEAYRMMVDAGFDDPLIVASNDLDEDLIASLKRQGARINAWGVGTHLITSKGCPSLNGVYKLVAACGDTGWEPRIKISGNPEKATDPGRKRVLRFWDADEMPLGDMMLMFDEDDPVGPSVMGRNHMHPHQLASLRGVARCESLLEVVVENGHRVCASPSISSIRDRALSQIGGLTEELKRLRNPEVYRVILSDRIGSRKDDMLLRAEF